MASKIEFELMSLVLKTGVLQPLSSSSRGGKVSVLCRILPGQDRAWPQVARLALLALRDAPQTRLHCCRQYVLMGEDVAAGAHIELELSSGGVKAVREALRTLETAWEGTIPAAVVENPTPEAPAAPEPTKEVVDPAFAADLDVRRAKAEAGTTAAPRASEYTPDPVPPPNYQPRLEARQTGTMKDARGRLVPVIEETMPLPHMYGVTDMNRPHGKTARGKDSERGAYTIA